MAQVVFQHIAGGIRLGKQLKVATGETLIQPGILVKLSSGGSTVVVNTVNNNPLGIAFGSRYSTYRPTTKVFAAGEPLTVIHGIGEALLTSDFFSGGSMPVAGDLLYAQASGLWGMQGSAKVGKCLEIVPGIEFGGGVGTAQNLAHIIFEIIP